MTSNVQSTTTTVNADVVPTVTNETETLDQSEKEYDRMISQHVMYHHAMMEDLMKLSSVSGSNLSSNKLSNDQLSVVAGLGNTVAATNASNTSLLQFAQNMSNDGSQNAITASKLDAEIKKTQTNLQDTVKQYDALMQQMQKEGFSNPSMDAALENSAIMSESEKYALVLFGVCAIYLFYKTVKYL